MEEVKQDVVAEVKPELDLVSKVAGFKEEETKPAETPQPPEDGLDKFDFKKLKDIRTPEEAQEWAEKAYKSMQGDYGRKTQTLAEQRKDLERQMTESNLWSPEKVQRLLNDQNFVAAAQSVMQSQNPPNSGKSDEEWSTLTEGEKSQIIELRNEIALLKQQNQQTSDAQQDELLKGKYANYDAKVVNQLKGDLINNRIRATNEHLWKVVDYESAIDRAYKLGRKEERELKGEKISNFSYTPESTHVTKEPTLSKEGEISLAQLYEHTKKINT